MFNRLFTKKTKKVIPRSENTRIKEKIAFLPDTICTLVSIDVTYIKIVNIKVYVLKNNVAKFGGNRNYSFQAITD